MQSIHIYLGFLLCLVFFSLSIQDIDQKELHEGFESKVSPMVDPSGVKIAGVLPDGNIDVLSREYLNKNSTTKITGNAGPVTVSFTPDMMMDYSGERNQTYGNYTDIFPYGSDDAISQYWKQYWYTKTQIGDMPISYDNMISNKSYMGKPFTNDYMLLDNNSQIVL